MNQACAQYIARKRQEYGRRFDPSGLAPQFAEHYHTDTRLKVRTCGLVITGTIGATTGWRPVFLLMRTRRSMGSPWCLGKDDEILGVKAPGRRAYCPTKIVTYVPNSEE